VISSTLRPFTAVVSALGLWTACADDKQPSTDSGAPVTTDTAHPCPSDPTCNGIDDDCDGLVDELAEPAMALWYPDLDGDGFGDPSASVEACAPPTHHIAVADDCDDADPMVHPEAWDPVGDGVDQDCDGADAVCGSTGGPRSVYDGDVTWTGATALTNAAAFCTEFDGIAGTLTITGTAWTDLSAASCVCAVTDGLVVTHNASLDTLAGLPTGRAIGRIVALTDNPALLSTAGLDGTTWTGVSSGNERLDIRRNPVLTDLSGFGGWSHLDQLHIRELDALTHLSGLPDLTRVTESAELRDNPLLTHVDGLTSLAEVVELRIEDNPRLAHLDGLGNLKSTGYLTLGGNAVADLTDFGGLKAIDDRLTIRGAPALTRLDGLVQLERLGGLRVEENPVLTDLTGLRDARAAEGIGGTVELHSNPMLTDLAGLDWVTWVHGDVILGGSADLTPFQSLHGLEQLEVVTGAFVVQRVLLLDDLEGLDVLREVGSLRIDGTDQPTTDPFQLVGAPALEVVHQTLDIRNHATLTHLTGLEALHTTGNLLVLDNPMLVSLDGLDGLRAADTLIALRNPRLQDVSALYGLQAVGDVCLDVPGDPTEPDALLAALGTTEVCP